eukprot:1977189-Pyramimonas_sp.AAC.2
MVIFETSRGWWQASEDAEERARAAYEEGRASKAVSPAEEPIPAVDHASRAEIEGLQQERTQLMVQVGRPPSVVTYRGSARGP